MPSGCQARCSRPDYHDGNHYDCNHDDCNHDDCNHDDCNHDPIKWDDHHAVLGDEVLGEMAT